VQPRSALKKNNGPGTETWSCLVKSFYVRGLSFHGSFFFFTCSSCVCASGQGHVQVRKPLVAAAAKARLLAKPAKLLRALCDVFLIPQELRPPLRASKRDPAEAEGLVVREQQARLPLHLHARIQSHCPLSLFHRHCPALLVPSLRYLIRI